MIGMERPSRISLMDIFIFPDWGRADPHYAHGAVGEVMPQFNLIALNLKFLGLAFFQCLYRHSSVEAFRSQGHRCAGDIQF